MRVVEGSPRTESKPAHLTLRHAHSMWNWAYKESINAQNFLNKMNTYFVICLLTNKYFFLTSTPSDESRSVSRSATHNSQTPWVHHFDVQLCALLNLSARTWCRETRTRGLLVVDGLENETQLRFKFRCTTWLSQTREQRVLNHAHHTFLDFQHLLYRNCIRGSTNLGSGNIVIGVTAPWTHKTE